MRKRVCLFCDKGSKDIHILPDPTQTGDTCPWFSNSSLGRSRGASSMTTVTPEYDEWTLGAVPHTRELRHPGCCQVQVNKRTSKETDGSTGHDHLPPHTRLHTHQQWSTIHRHTSVHYPSPMTSCVELARVCLIQIHSKLKVCFLFVDSTRHPASTPRQCFWSRGRLGWTTLRPKWK